VQVRKAGSHASLLSWLGSLAAPPGCSFSAQNDLCCPLQAVKISVSCCPQQCCLYCRTPPTVKTHLTQPMLTRCSPRKFNSPPLICSWPLFVCGRRVTRCHNLADVARLSEQPKVVLVTGLSLEHGLSRQLLVKWAGDSRNAVIFTQPPPVRSAKWHSPPLLPSVRTFFYGAARVLTVLWGFWGRLCVIG